MSWVFVDITSTIEDINIDDEEDNDAFEPADGGIGSVGEVNNDMAGVSASQIKTEIEQKPVGEGQLGEFASSTGGEFIRKYDAMPDGEEKLFSILAHVVQCDAVICFDVPDCYSMKTARSHFQICKDRKPNDFCYSCNRMVQFYFRHTKLCQEVICPLPICSKIKQWDKEGITAANANIQTTGQEAV